MKLYLFLIARGLVLLGLFGIFNGCSTSSDTPESNALILLLSGGNLTGSGSSQNIQDLSAYLADTVTEAPAENAGNKPANCTYGALGGFKDTSKITNGIFGGGNSSGSSDVYSLRGWSTHITLEWSGRRVIDGTGVDFIVFENAYVNLSNSETFIEPSLVEVSQDGTNWCGFNPDYTGPNENTHSTNTAHWKGFAGRSPVNLNQSTLQIELNDIFLDADDDWTMDQAGGDGFDLQNLVATNTLGCDASERTAIITNGFVYLRITDSNQRTNPDTTNPYPWASGSFDCASDYDGILARDFANR